MTSLPPTDRKTPLSECFALMLTILLCTTASPAQVHSKPETYYYLVFSNPVPGKEAEYNRWYDQQHAPDVVAVPGFVSAQRFALADEQLRAASVSKPKYLVIYKVVTDDFASVRAEINRRIQSGRTRISPTFDVRSAYSVVYRALGDERPGAGGEPPDAKPGNSQTYLQIVFSDPVPGQEKEFNRWYAQQHAPSVANAPGFVSWQRGILSDQQLGPPSEASQYLAIFKIVTTDLSAVLRSFHVRVAHATSRGSDSSAASDNRRILGYTYRAIGPVLVGDDIRSKRSLLPDEH